MNGTTTDPSTFHRTLDYLGHASVTVLLALMLAGTMAFPLHAQEDATPPQTEEKTPPDQFSSVEERRLFNAIQTERGSIREEKKDLELRKKELKSMEEGVDKKLAEIDSKLEEMKALRKDIEKQLAAKSEEETKRTLELAKIYEKMSPDKAAMAISGLKPQLAADLLKSMKVKAAAKILDEISRQKATELSTTFSTIQIE